MDHLLDIQCNCPICVDVRRRAKVKSELDDTLKSDDMVNHPPHYTSSLAKCSCGKSIECIEVIEHMTLCLGNVIKYIWRADLKGNKLEDLKKAQFYLNREIARLERANG